MLEMKSAAKAREYERAASIRDLIEALKRTTQRTRKFERNLTGFSQPGEAVDRLQKKLELNQGRTRSSASTFHISGSFCVASMVCFKTESLTAKTIGATKLNLLSAMMTSARWKRLLVGATVDCRLEKALSGINCR